MATETYDAVIYGTTMGAVDAAIGAAKDGANVAVIADKNHLGGPLTNGLSVIDYGKNGSLTRYSPGNDQFYHKNAMYWGSYRRFASRTHPGAAERFMTEMLTQAGVTIRWGKTLASVAKAGTALTSITDTAGLVYAGSQFLDGTDEGDLAAMAGVTMVTGGEAISAQEPLAGYYLDPAITIMNPYISGTTLLPRINPIPGLATGAAFPGYQVPTFRMCLTNELRMQRRWPRPDNDDPTLWEYRRRRQDVSSPTFLPFGINGKTWNGKVDVNGDYGYGLWNWSTSSVAARAAIQQNLEDEVLGWLYFCANDPSVHPNCRAFMDKWRLPLDEFTDNKGFPREAYWRTNRRIQGQYVMKQNDLQIDVTKPGLSISLGYYSIDVHPYQLVVSNAGTGYQVQTIPVAPGDPAPRQVLTYEIPFTCFLPQAAQTTNLLVSNAMSSTAIAMGSLRIDIHRGAGGYGLGRAIAQCLATGQTLNTINMTTLQATLTAEGQPIHYPYP